jgi:hypothetical protein
VRVKGVSSWATGGSLEFVHYPAANKERQYIQVRNYFMTSNSRGWYMRHASAERRVSVGLTVTTPKHVAITLAAQFSSLRDTASITDHFSSSLLPQRLRRARKSFSKIQGAGG